MSLVSIIPAQERRFTITEIKNYILSQDSMGDVLYNLNEENIVRANEDYRDEKKLILDYSTWRCGGHSENALGKGDTMLLNEDGYMCCLGQFSLQLKPELSSKRLLHLGVPDEIGEEIPFLATPSNMCDHIDDVGYYQNTQLADEAIAINDNPVTTPEHKIDQLKALFAQVGYEIEVINKPIDPIHLDGLDGVR